ncbi:lasso peptide biosynthesis B2 protein [Peterkaempfera bronchialis]|uniref:lasso peptide biosynthesis B2 protein n=1 Tax=Peterkaempfera bronchialis TaxID=2126346 RepID=UPI003C2F7C27
MPAPKTDRKCFGPSPTAGKDRSVCDIGAAPTGQVRGRWWPLSGVVWASSAVRQCRCHGSPAARSTWPGPGTRSIWGTRTAGARFGRLRQLAEVGCGLPPPTAGRARPAVRSVRWAARAFPARVACLEESTAASLLLALGGRGGVWRHGVATDPIRLHAWICDLRGQPVGPGRWLGSAGAQP